MLFCLKFERRNKLAAKVFPSLSLELVPSSSLDFNSKAGKEREALADGYTLFRRLARVACVLAATVCPANELTLLRLRDFPRLASHESRALANSHTCSFGQKTTRLICPHP